jgi:SAM-dependent methyltransferase
VRQELLDILAEPATGAPLRLVNARYNGQGTLEEGELVSDQTGRSFPIVRGIPRFVAAKNYADNFGMQWNRFRQVQIDSENRADVSRKRFDNSAAWDAAELDGKLLLDAGCGAGRFAEIAAARGAYVVGLDISSAVDAARMTLTRFPNVDLVQASITEPPFRPGTFDYAYCIGVVQHTPAPPETIASVIRMLRQGGRFAFVIYARRPWTKLHSKYLMRPITRRLPPAMLLWLIEKSMPIMFPVTDKLFRLPVAGKLFGFTLPIATYIDRDYLPREQRYREAILDTFDMLSPRYDSPMKPVEVEEALRDVGVKSWTFKERIPINCVGVR